MTSILEELEQKYRIGFGLRRDNVPDRLDLIFKGLIEILREIKDKKDQHPQKLTEKQIILVNVAGIAMGEIPKTFSEFGDLVWKIFHLGERYKEQELNVVKVSPS